MKRKPDSLAPDNKIELVGRANVNTALLFLAGFALTGFIIQLLIFSRVGLGLTLIASLTVFLLAFLLLFRNFWRSMATAYIRGEMLIVKYFRGDVRITELRHVHMTKTSNILGICVSGLRFRLDGKHHKVLIFGMPFGNKYPTAVLTSLGKAAA